MERVVSVFRREEIMVTTLLDWIESQEEISDFILPIKLDFYKQIKVHEDLGNVDAFLDFVEDNGGYENLPD